jgi:hypothetical protein
VIRTELGRGLAGVRLSPASLQHPGIAAIYGVEEGAVVLKLRVVPFSASEVTPIRLGEQLPFAMTHK